MTTQVTSRPSFLHRYLVLWIFAVLLVASPLDGALPGVVPVLNRFRVGTTSIPIAVGLILISTRPWPKCAMKNWARSFTTGKFSSYRWCTIGDAELGDRPSPDVCLGHHFFCAAIHHDDVIGTALINCDGRTRAVLLPILRDFPAFVVSVNRGFRAPGCPMLSTSAPCRWNSRFLNPCLAQRCEAYPEHLQTGQLPSGTAAHQSSSPDIHFFFS